MTRKDTMDTNVKTPVKDMALTRRTVLAGAAWTAPVILLTAAAPAAAASGVIDARLRWNTWRNNYVDDGHGNVTGIKTGVQIENNYHADDTYQVVSKPVDVVYVFVKFSAGACAGEAPTSVTGGGWSFVSHVVNSDGSVEYQFQHVGTVNPSLNTGELNFVVAATRVSGATASAYAIAPNADSAKAPVSGNPIY